MKKMLVVVALALVSLTLSPASAQARITNVRSNANLGSTSPGLIPSLTIAWVAAALIWL